MIVFRIRGKIVRTVLCCVVYDSCTQRYTHEQFLKVNVGLGLIFVHLFRFSICVFLWFSLGCFVFALFASVQIRFSFFSSKPRDWLGRTCPKCLVFCQVGCKTLTQSVNSTYSSFEVTS